MANNWLGGRGPVSVYNFESITAGGPNIEASASSEYSATYAAWKAFDFSSATWWRTTTGGAAPCWLAISWGAGNEKVVASYAVTSMATYQTAAPNAWTFDGYDGASWVTLDTQTGQTAWGSGGETRTFAISNTTAYAAYRLNISANNGGTTTVIATLALYSAGGINLALDMPGNALITGTVSDSKGNNDLTAVGNGTLPVVDAVNFKEGAAALDLENGNWNYLFRPDNKLSSGFPFKAGTTNYSCSTTQWVQAESVNSYYWTIWSKDTIGISDGHRVFVYGDDLYYRVQCEDNFYTETALNVMQTGRWYFIATVWDNATKTMRLYVWDDILGSVVADNSYDWSATAPTPTCNGGDWLVGGHARNDGTVEKNWDGLIDEHTVWNRALSTKEIEDIRDGTFSAVVVHEAAGAVSARSSVSVPASGIRVNPQRAAGLVTARSQITLAHYQYKSHAFVPAQVLAEPYPVPMLWQYLAAGFEEGARMWAERMSQWSEEHISRVMRDVAKLGQEKTTDWVEV